MIPSLLEKTSNNDFNNDYYHISAAFPIPISTMKFKYTACVIVFICNHSIDSAQSSRFLQRAGDDATAAIKPEAVAEIKVKESIIFDDVAADKDDQRRRSQLVADFWYPEYSTSWDMGICKNTLPLPYGNVNDRPNYSPQLDCCKTAAYAGQVSHLNQYHF